MRWWSWWGKGVVVVCLGMGVAGCGLERGTDDHPAEGEGVPAARIVSLAPSLTQMLAGMGLAGRIVGVTAQDDAPEAGAARVGGMDAPDLEAVLALRPDLVVATTLTPPDGIRRLRELGVRVEAFEHRDLADVAEDWQRLGEVCGEPEAGRAAAERFRKEVEAVTVPPGGRRPRVLVLLGLADTVSAGRGTFVDEVITRAGGENVAARVAAGWPQLNLETILELDPEVVMATPLAPGGEDDVREAWRMLRQDPRWQHLTAAREDALLVLPYGVLEVPGPGLADAVRQVAAGLKAWRERSEKRADGGSPAQP